MKISIHITMEIDPEEWTTTFGVEGAAKIREDVKAYVCNEVPEAGVFGSREVQLKSYSWK